MLHRLIEEFHTVNWSLDIAERYRELMDDEEHHSDESDVPIYWKEDREPTIDKLVDEVVEMLENYRGKDYNRDANVILSESKFMLKVGRNVFSGTVDQIRQNDNGEFTLLDFKSSKFPPNQTFLDVDYQFGLYSLACWKGVFKLPDGTMKMLEIPPDKLRIVYYHLRDHIPYKRNGKGFQAGDERGDPRKFTSRTRDQLKVLKRDVGAIASNINRGVFPRNPGTINCPACAYSAICIGDSRIDGLSAHQIKSIETLNLPMEEAA
ncbi:PD-(D/E)XK nuclease superfamily protein [bacterium BMS3Bbin04]|nr:PD-(D/E)XK nuclease superfamily protein [bacterium BMS3Bbin04]